MKRTVAFYLRLGVSVLLIVFFASSVDIDRLFRPIGPSGWLYIGLAVLLANVDRIVMSYKWTILLKAKGIALRFTEVIRSYYIGTFWGAFLPAPAAGDVVRAYCISAQIHGAETIVSSMIIERIFGMISCFLTSILTVFVYTIFVAPETWKIATTVAFSFILFLGSVILSFNSRLLLRFQQPVLLINQDYLRKLAQIHESYQAYKHQHGPILRFLLWSLLEQFVPILCVFSISRALSLGVPFWSFLVFVPLILLVLKIPVSLGFGVNEGLFIYFFSFVGLSASEAFALGFLANIVTLVSLLPGFFYYSFSLPSPATVRSGLPG